MRTCAFIKPRGREMPLDAALGPEVCHCFAVRSAARHVTQFYDQLLEPTGLRITQYSILAMLKRLGPLTINALAKVLLTDRTTLGRNILPLERDGLIRIEQGASDRRAKELHLTTAGEKRLRAARHAWLKAQATFESSFGTKRAETLRALLRALVASEFGATDQGGSRRSPTTHDR
jgi:DNA-binding MarR family transcriptional regulator